MASNAVSQLTIYISNDDADIAEWLNLIQSQGQSRSRWISALIVAYTRGEVVLTGNIVKKPWENLPPPAEIPKPTSNAPFELKGKSKQQAWKVKDINGGFTKGSNVFIRFSNTIATSALNKLREESRVPISTIPKEMIRMGFSGGTSDYVPDVSIIAKYMKIKELRMGIHFFYENYRNFSF